LPGSSFGWGALDYAGEAGNEFNLELVTRSCLAKQLGVSMTSNVVEFLIKEIKKNSAAFYLNLAAVELLDGNIQPQPPTKPRIKLSQSLKVTIALPNHGSPLHYTRFEDEDEGAEATPFVYVPMPGRWLLVEMEEEPTEPVFFAFPLVGGGHLQVNAEPHPEIDKAVWAMVPFGFDLAADQAAVMSFTYPFYLNVAGNQGFLNYFFVYPVPEVPPWGGV
jgi:hypothetical protein